MNRNTAVEAILSQQRRTVAASEELADVYRWWSRPADAALPSTTYIKYTYSYWHLRMSAPASLKSAFYEPTIPRTSPHTPIFKVINGETHLLLLDGRMAHRTEPIELDGISDGIIRKHNRWYCMLGVMSGVSMWGSSMLAVAGTTVGHGAWCVALGTLAGVLIIAAWAVGHIDVPGKRNPPVSPVERRPGASQ